MASQTTRSDASPKIQSALPQTAARPRGRVSGPYRVPTFPTRREAVGRAAPGRHPLGAWLYDPRDGADIRDKRLAGEVALVVGGGVGLIGREATWASR
jgi:hypothetical protein